MSHNQRDNSSVSQLAIRLKWDLKMHKVIVLPCSILPHGPDKSDSHLVGEEYFQVGGLKPHFN